MSEPTPTTAALTCSVAIDGQTLGEDVDLQPIDGLRVTWGRETVIDQPEPTTCSVKVLDAPDGPRYHGMVRVGRRLQVYASGQIATGEQGAFLGGDLTWRPMGRWPTTGDRHDVLAGAASGTEVGVALAGAARVLLTPADRPADGLPGGWDALLPRGDGNSAFVIEVIGRTPAARFLEVRGADMRGPNAGQPRLLATDSQTRTRRAASPGITEQTITARAIPGQDMFLGVELMATGPGLTWAQATGSWADAQGSWRDYGDVVVTSIRVQAPTYGIARRVLVFDGRITEATANYRAGMASVEVDVQATADPEATLANRYVGDDPWPVQSLTDRVTRILNAAGAEVVGTRTVIPPRVGAVAMTRRDVDRQAALDLLSALATSADAVLWSASHLDTGPFLQFEDIRARASLYTLGPDPDGVLRINASTNPDVASTPLSACDVLEAPTRALQSVSDVATRVAVDWHDQAEQPTPAQRTEQVINADLEADIGSRRVSFTSELQSQADARDLAAAILARSAPREWRIADLVLDTETADLGGSDLRQTVLDLLDSTLRIGRPLTITDLPAWVGRNRIVAYLEGGHYEYRDDCWQLTMLASQTAGVGQSATWAQVPRPWRWNQLDPSISWLDMTGTGIAAP